MARSPHCQKRSCRPAPGSQQGASCPRKVRWFLCQFVIVISTFAFGVMFGTGEIRSDNPGEKGNDDCPMGGCSWSRNPVNTRDKNMPTEWSTEEGQRKNIKWVARLDNTT